MKRLCALAAVCALTAACSPHISDTEASTLAREVRPLLERHTVGPLPREVWPASIVTLEPRAVYVRADGLYITTWSFFIEERGVFVANAKALFKPGRGTDPQYEPVGHGVFVYRIAG